MNLQFVEVLQNVITVIVPKGLVVYIILVDKYFDNFISKLIIFKTTNIKSGIYERLIKVISRKNVLHKKVLTQLFNNSIKNKFLEIRVYKWCEKFIICTKQLFENNGMTKNKKIGNLSKTLLGKRKTLVIWVSNSGLVDQYCFINILFSKVARNQYMSSEFVFYHILILNWV